MLEILVKILIILCVIACGSFYVILYAILDDELESDFWWQKTKIDKKAGKRSH